MGHCNVNWCSAEGYRNTEQCHPMAVMTRGQDFTLVCHVQICIDCVHEHGLVQWAVCGA